MARRRTLTRVTYKGQADGYLVYDEKLKIQFVIRKDEEIEIPPDLYKTLEHEHIGEGKLTNAEPSPMHLDKNRKWTAD